ncbi:hypothetical protein MMAGJ_66510 [Mycolicibacterium mageritense]|uniref:Uncharacterized protein n=1 Tax=Mycolicibacterium mageritense TaxID=53462 RepID=A0ABN5YJC7_MYCME|nr:hypothetical protein MMAGJ_66510 [Mycolicibacterium mageritense]
MLAAAVRRLNSSAVVAESLVIKAQNRVQSTLTTTAISGRTTNPAPIVAGRKIQRGNPGVLVKT